MRSLLDGRRLCLSAALLLVTSHLAALPDLVPSDISFSKSVVGENEQITLSVTVRNAGDAYHDQVVSTPIAKHDVFEGTNETGVVIHEAFNPFWVAQLVSPTETVHIGRASFRVRDLGNSDDIILEVRNDSGSSPPVPGTGDNNLIAKRVLDSTNTASPYDWQDFDLAASIQLSAGATYWFCLENENPDTSHAYGVWRDSGTSVNQVALSGSAGSSWVDGFQAIGRFQKIFHRLYRVQDIVVRFYQGDPSAGGTLVAVSTVSAPIAAGGSAVVTGSWTAPQAGDYHLYAVVDDPDLINESNAANNTISGSVSVVDVMSSAVENVLIGSDLQTKLVLPAGLVSTPEYFVAIDVAPSVSASIQAANAKAGRDRDAFSSPVAGTLRRIRLFQGGAPGTLVSDFNGTAMLTIPYSDDGQGYVSGLSPRVKEENQAIYWLNEEDGLWVRLPRSEVDIAANTVTAPVPHFSYFVLMGLSPTDLSQSYAYPVPFRPNAGLGHTTVKFTGLSPQCVIRIYTLSGELLRTIEESDGDGFNDTWDASDAASGTYLYVIENDSERRTGQLVIIK